MPTKESLVRASELRARIVAYLSKHPGTEFRSGELASDLDAPRDKITDQLTNLSTSGQIEVRPQGRIRFFSVPGNSAPKDENAPAPQPSPPPKSGQKQSRQTVAASSGEVELVLSGITIIAGRNPKTGRIRIELA